MPMGRQSTVLERTAHMLGPRYDISVIREDHDGGYVTFQDPMMCRREWTGPIYTGIVRYTAKELRQFQADPNASARIRDKVEEAKAALLALITEHERKEGVALSKLAISLSLMLFAIIPASQFF